MTAAKPSTAIALSGALSVPTATTVVICILAAMQAAVELMPSPIVVDLITTFSLIPARISFLFSSDAYTPILVRGIALGLSETDISSLLGYSQGVCWTLLSYALLHGGWAHLSLNCFMLAIFGGLLERRLGPNRFLAFLAVSAMFGGLAYCLLRPFDLRPVIGASASVAAAMAASARFAFAPGGPLGGPGVAPMQKVITNGAGKAALSHMFTNQRAMGFLGLWFGMTLLAEMLPQAEGISSHVAWEAHLGGVVAGLLLFDLFDPSRRSINRRRSGAF